MNTSEETATARDKGKGSLVGLADVWYR